MVHNTAQPTDRTARSVAELGNIVSGILLDAICPPADGESEDAPRRDARIRRLEESVLEVSLYLDTVQLYAALKDVINAMAQRTGRSLVWAVDDWSVAGLYAQLSAHPHALLGCAASRCCTALQILRVVRPPANPDESKAFIAFSPRATSTPLHLGTWRH